MWKTWSYGFDCSLSASETGKGLPFSVSVYRGYCMVVFSFHTSHVRISQKVKGFLMWNLRHIIFIWRRRYWEIFISALVYI